MVSPSRLSVAAMAEKINAKTSTIHHDEQEQEHEQQPNSATNLEEGLILEDIALEPAGLYQLGAAIDELNVTNIITTKEEEDDNDAQSVTMSTVSTFEAESDDLQIVPFDEGNTDALGGPIGIFDHCPNTPGGASTQDGTAISSIGSVSARQAVARREHELHSHLEELPRSMAVTFAPCTKSNSILEDDTDEDDQTAIAGIAARGDQEQLAGGKLPRCLTFLDLRRKFEIAAVLLSLTAFVLTGTATDNCDFVQVGNDHLQNYWELPERDVGLVQFETITSECTYWFDNPKLSDTLYDSVWHAARVMSMTATMLGLMLVGFICSVSCLTYRAVVFQRLAFGSLIIPLFYGMSFIVFGSDMCQAGTCTIGIGGLVMILGILVWLMLAVVLFMIPESNKQDAKTSGAQQSTTNNFDRNRMHLVAAIVLVMTTCAVVNTSVILGREDGDDAGRDMSLPPSNTDIDTQWSLLGETTMGPYPDTPNYVSLSGDATVMSLIGKESVLVMEHDAEKGLWYPFGDMIPANWDYKGWDSDDRVTKVRATAAAVSEDGHIMAVASSSWANPISGGDNYEFGKVQVFRYDTSLNHWMTKGHPLTGKAKGDSFGSRVAISNDGRRLAVLANGHFEQQQPYVRVYHYSDVLGGNGNWEQVGGDMELEATWVPSGFAFSGDGSTVALGSLRIGRLGLVTVWQYGEDDLTWKRQGSTIGSSSSTRDDKFGEAVAVSFDGSVLIAGDPGGRPGYARVLSFKNREWKQLGQDLECDAPDGQCAHDVAISNYGSTVAITGYHAYQVARVYSLAEGQDQWVQVGTDIIGSEPREVVQSTAVDLSSDGQSIAFGITSQETMTHVWQYTGNDFSDVPLTGSTPEESGTLTPEAPSQETLTAIPSEANFTDINDSGNTNASVPLPPVDDTEESEPEETELSQNASHSPNESAMPFLHNVTAQSTNAQPLQPWTQATSHEDVFYFLFGSALRIERYDMFSRTFLPPIILPTQHGLATAFGVGEQFRLYVAYGTDVYGYSADGGDETQIQIEAKAVVVDFQFDGDMVFINAGEYFISVDGSTYTLIGEFFSNSKLVGTSVSPRHRRVFGRTPDELNSDGVIRQSDLWYKEYNERGEFVDEKAVGFNTEVEFETAAKTWVFPDQTRVVDDNGLVFSVASSELVYSIETQEILDVAWLGGDVMIALHSNGQVTAISQDLVTARNLTLDFSPANIAVNHGAVLSFTFDAMFENGVRVDDHNIALLIPALAGSSIVPSNVPFVPEFPFLDKTGQLYMLSKGHSSIFVMTPGDQTYTESIKLDEIPKYVAYSSTHNEIYTLREGGVLCKIDLNNENRTEVEITNLSSTPLGLSTAGEFIFVCDESGSFATHSTFFSNGTLASAVDGNHIDKEYVWSQANRKMFFFRQADPTDLMTEHIFDNATIGNRVDSYLNNNSGFEHPIRVDPRGRHAILGSGIIHNARTLERLQVSLANSVHDISFTDTTIRTIRHVGENVVQLQEWNGTTFELMREAQVTGRAHRLLALDESTTVALTTDAFGKPVVYTVDIEFNVV